MSQEHMKEQSEFCVMYAFFSLSYPLCMLHVVEQLLQDVLRAAPSQYMQLFVSKATLLSLPFLSLKATLLPLPFLSLSFPLYFLVWQEQQIISYSHSHFLLPAVCLGQCLPEEFAMKFWLIREPRCVCAVQCLCSTVLFLGLVCCVFLRSFFSLEYSEL